MSADTKPSEDTHQAAYDLALVLADTEYMTAHRYSEWAMLGAPDIEEDIALSSVIQDELGHGRAAYKTAADIGDTSVDDLVYERPVDEWRSPTVLDSQLGSWAEIITSLATLDLATVLVYENLREGSYDSLSSIAGKVLQEESQHIQHGQAWLSVFADEPQDEFPKATAQASLDRFVPAVIHWLGRDEGSEELVDAGVFARSNEEMRDEFVSAVEETVDANGFDMPDVSPDFSEWDDAIRRPTAPGGDEFETAVNEATGREHRYLAGQ